MKLGAMARKRLQEDEVEEFQDNLKLYDAWLPIIKRLGLPGQVDVRDYAQKLGQLGLMVVAELAVNGVSEKVRASCGKELAYMGGLKPVDRSVGMDVHVMAEADVDALLMSKAEELGLLRGSHGIQSVEGTIVEPEERSIEAVIREGEDSKG